MRNYDGRKRILVTGGAGFLGSHLIDRLLAAGSEVVCADNLFTGSKRNIEHVHDHPRFEFIRHVVTFLLYVEVDEIWNLACPASPVHCQHDPVQRQPDISLAQQKLDWEPKVQLKEGLRHTIAYFDELLSGTQ